MFLLFVDLNMQKWFNKLDLIPSIFTCAIISIVGVLLILFRLKNHTPIGVGIGIGLIIESLILIYRKYISNSKND